MAGPKVDKLLQDKKPQRHPTAAQVEEAIRKATEWCGPVEIGELVDALEGADEVGA